MASVSNVVLIALLCVAVSCAETSGETKKQNSDAVPPIRLQDVVFVVRSQPNSFHKGRAELFEAHFMVQLAETDKEEWPILEILDEAWFDFHIGYWAFVPILPRLVELYGDKSWVFLCEEDTRVDIFKLLQLLKKYNPQKMQFLGKALRDESAVIIHHFAFAEDPHSFAYPDFGAGVAFSMPLIKWLSSNVKSMRNFAIDVQHEIAKLIFDEADGKRLTHIPQLCTVPGERCITHLAEKFVDCGPAIPEKDLFVAVKTCSKFHDTRVPIVKSTWGKETQYIEYYSDVADPSIPTVSLGIPNTERGHCGKTRAILQRATKRKSPITQPWLLIADDDTIINLQRLRELLACYNSSEMIHLGERYGYYVHELYGYSYITGGGGMVFSRTAIQQLKDLECPNDAPDDMTLGRYLERKHLPLTHSFHFHQGRLEDYSPGFLAGRIHISFHKHWNSDPLKTYAFLTDKTNTATDKTKTPADRDEL